MPSRYESEGQYSPRNLMNIVNSASSIVNSIGKAENQGLIREDRAKKKKILDATNKAQEVMVAGATPEEAQTHLQGQTEYNDPGWFDKIMGEKEGQIKSFTPATAELGYQNALKLRNQSADATTDNYTNTYRQQMSKMPIKDISNFDFNKAENPYAARKAQGELLSLYGNSQVAKERSAVATEKNGQRMFQHYEGGVIEAKAALAKGNKKEARKMAHKLVNELNNNSYKAKDSGEGMKLGVTYDGVDKWDDKEIPVEELIGHLEQITKDKYMDSFHKNAEFHRKVNAGTAENPLLFVNKDGGIAKVMTEGESFTSGHNVVVFGPDNKKIPITDLKDLYKMGYTPYKQKAGTSGKTIDKGKQFDALSKRIGNTVEMMVKNNPAKWATDGEGGYIDVTTNQAAGNAPYAAALLNQMQSGLITKEDAAQYAAAVGITPQDMQIAAGVAGSGGKHGEIKGAILGTTPISADEQARRGEKTAQQKKNSPFALDRNTWTKPLVEKVKPLFQGNTMPIIDDPYAR